MINYLNTFWQLPQNIIGYFISKKCKFRHKINYHLIYEISHIDGISLGKYIFVNPKCPEGILLKHEYGHCIQSNILGWLYIFVIFIPSYFWYLYFCEFCNEKPDSEYYKFYTEKWANDLINKRKGF